MEKILNNLIMKKFNDLILNIKMKKHENK